MSTDKVYHNVSKDLLEPLENSCASIGCKMEKYKDPSGNYTVVCKGPEPASAAGATVSGAESLSGLGILASQAVPLNKANRDLSLLHPLVRKKVNAIQKALDGEAIPMRVFEAYRYPQRQRYLYNKGRTGSGSKVTNADAWQSYHQYGLAADFVRYEDGGWNWDTDTAQKRRDWDRFHDIARSEGLEPLSWEKPHVQIVGITLSELMNGQYPNGGDESWSENLANAIAGWPESGAPPPPAAVDKPAMPAVLAGAAAAAPSGTLNWHAMFGGDAWAYDKHGVYTSRPDGTLKTWRSAGAPITVQEVIAQLEPQIAAASGKYGIAPELIVMTVATETGIYRKSGFTGPETFRWEAGYKVNATGNPAYDGKERGDYSAGPMQVLSDTARWMNDRYKLGYANDTDFTFFKNKPNPKTAKIGLYDPAICVDAGAAYLRHNMSKTGDDPLLVAAAYNAGGLYPDTTNHWRIRSHGNHLDRAAEWYGDACSVLYG